MKKNLNNDSSLKEQLLIILMEECSEIIKDCSKCLRFTLDDKNPNVENSKTNRENLINEINDLLSILIIMEDYNILSESPLTNFNKIRNKREKVFKYIEYSKNIKKENTND